LQIRVLASSAATEKKEIGERERFWHPNPGGSNGVPYPVFNKEPPCEGNWAALQCFAIKEYKICKRTPNC